MNPKQVQNLAETKAQTTRTAKRVTFSFPAGCTPKEGSPKTSALKLYQSYSVSSDDDSESIIEQRQWEYTLKFSRINQDFIYSSYLETNEKKNIKTNYIRDICLRFETNKMESLSDPESDIAEEMYEYIEEIFFIEQVLNPIPQSTPDARVSPLPESCRKRLELLININKQKYELAYYEAAKIYAKEGNCYDKFIKWENEIEILLYQGATHSDRLKKFIDNKISSYQSAIELLRIELSKLQESDSETESESEFDFLTKRERSEKRTTSEKSATNPPSAKRSR